MAHINLTRSNRAVGLMNELAELISQEDSSLELARIEATLRSLSHAARSRSQEVETDTREITRAVNARKVRKPASLGSRISMLAGRC